MKYLALILFVLASPLSALGEGEKDECVECRKRKTEMCTEECALVNDRKSECINQCVKDYCSHKCLKLKDMFSDDPVHLD